MISMFCTSEQLGALWLRVKQSGHRSEIGDLKINEAKGKWEVGANERRVTVSIACAIAHSNQNIYLLFIWLS